MIIDAPVAEELRPDMYSYLNLGDSQTAYIIGNGNSRRGLDLSILDGDVWGCNALFRDYTPDYLTIVDTGIMGECCASRYPKFNKCYFSGDWIDQMDREQYETVKDTMMQFQDDTIDACKLEEYFDESHTKYTLHGKGNSENGLMVITGIGLEEDYKISKVGGPEDDYYLFENWFCGTTAAAMASLNHDYSNVVFVGFDSVWNYNKHKYNNIYAGTSCYALESDVENQRLVAEDLQRGYSSQTTQLKILVDRFPNIDYYIMKDELSVEPLEQYLV